jgi:hypothetical protein
VPGSRFDVPINVEDPSGPLRDMDQTLPMGQVGPKNKVIPATRCQLEYSGVTLDGDGSSVGCFISGSHILFPVHLGLMVAIVLMLGGLVAIRDSITEGLAGTLARFGLAASLSRVYPRWLGWVAVVGGAGGTVSGVVPAYIGEPSTLTTELGMQRPPSSPCGS